MKKTRLLLVILVSFITFTSSAQTSEWKKIGAMTVYRDGITANSEVTLYRSTEDEPLYKIKLSGSSNYYIVTPNPSYRKSATSGKDMFQYVAGDYYLNLANASIQTDKWKTLGTITAYKDGNKSYSATMTLYYTQNGDKIYRLKESGSSRYYIVTPNPSYRSSASSGKDSFRCVAGDYYLDFWW